MRTLSAGGSPCAPRSATLVLALCCLVVACGKKGPPLPPLVKVPIAPAELVAERRGPTVALQFIVPNANTDNSRPANISRVDVYAVTGPPTPAPLTDDQVLKRGTRIATVSVKAPRDPNQTIEEDEPEADMETPEGRGLDQGARAHVTEELVGPALVPVEVSKDNSKNNSKNRKTLVAFGPLLAPPPIVLSRTYLGVGVSTRGRKGPTSQRAAVPLVPPPPPPASLEITYDERAVTLNWSPVTLGPVVQGAASDDELPSSPIGPAGTVGAASPTIKYNVYDVVSSAKLTGTALAATEFSDPRVVWGERRCYTVRAAETVAGMTVESEAAAPACETLIDTFPPSAPANVQSSPGEGAISLIWDPNGEKDLAGYVVFRGIAPGDDLRQITPMPIQEPTFRDPVQPGVLYVYAVKAVDKAGNSSPLSDRVQETAR